MSGSVGYDSELKIPWIIIELLGVSMDLVHYSYQSVILPIEGIHKTEREKSAA